MLLSRRTAQAPAPASQPIFSELLNRQPAQFDAVLVDGFIGEVTAVGWEYGQPSPFYGETELAVCVSGLNGEWNFWLRVSQLEATDLGWSVTSPAQPSLT